METLYETNKDFKEYVDKCALNTGRSVKEVFDLALTREVAKQYAMV